MAERRYEKAIGIPRINDDGSDLLGIAKPEVIPGLASIA